MTNPSCYMGGCDQRNAVNPTAIMVGVSNKEPLTPRAHLVVDAPASPRRRARSMSLWRPFLRRWSRRRLSSLGRATCSVVALTPLGTIAHGPRGIAQDALVLGVCFAEPRQPGSQVASHPGNLQSIWSR